MYCNHATLNTDIQFPNGNNRFLTSNYVKQLAVCYDNFVDQTCVIFYGLAEKVCQFTYFFFKWHVRKSLIRPYYNNYYYYAAFLSRHFSHKSSNSKAHTHINKN